MSTSDTFAHDPNGQRHQRELIWSPLAIHAANRAAFYILLQIEADTFFLIARENLFAEHLLAIRRSDDHKIIATHMPDKIVRIAILIDHSLTNMPNQEDHTIASQESVHIVKRFEVIQIHVEHTP